MVWPFSGKKKQTGMPSILPFKSGAAFFESQCEFGHTEIKPKQGIVALVLDAKKEFGTPVAVKVEPDGQQMAMLKVASEDGGFVVAAKTPTGKGDRLKPDDVVIWAPMLYASSAMENAGDMDPRFGWVGIIVAKVAPEIDISNPDLRIISRFD